MAKTGSFAVLILLAILSACSDELKLVGDGEPIPVVYAIFDATDTTHSIKLSKSFAEESSVFDQLTKENLYYSNPQITLLQVSSGTEYSFQETSDIHKSPGIFPEEINPIYTLNNLLPSGEYLLQIIPDAETSLIEERITLFQDLKIHYPGPSTKRIYFYDDPLTFIWSPSRHVASYELAFTLAFEEVDNDLNKSIKHLRYSRSIETTELEWLQDRWKYRLYSDPVFGKFARDISNSDQIKYRKPIQLTLLITAADAELNQFIDQNNPDTKVEINYKGNLTGAIGIAAAKYTVELDNLQLSPRAMDSLRSGRFTKNMKFVGNPDW